MNELARLIANLPPEKRAEMLRRLEQRGRAKEARPPVPALPLSFAQQRLWLHYQLEPGSVAYNLTVAFRILGALDGQALERSLHAVVERHESLRTTFRMEKDSPVQVVSPEASVRLERIELDSEPAGRRDERIHEHVRTEAQRPFELGTGPLLRASLFRLDEREHVLVLCMHHIVTDGWSFGVLLRELLACYDALVAGKPPELPPLPIQYPQFAQWQRERLQGSLLEEQLGYWRERLAGAPAALELPTSHPRPPGLSGRGDQYSFTLPRELAEAVKAFAAREGATSIMVLKAAWHVLLSRYSGQEDLCVGLPSAGRDHADLERLIGFFINTLVVRTRPAGSLPFRDFLRQVREAMLGALAHQEMPLQKLLEELRPPREPGRTPLFQVSFSAAVPVPSLNGAGLELHRFPIRAEAAAFELGLVMAEHTDGLTGRFDYSTDLFVPAAIARMAEHLVVLLEAAVAAPGTPLAQLPLMSEAERRQVLVEWNETEKPHRGEHCIHELFAAQAARTPEAVALTFGGQSLTYRELEVRANQLAHALQRLEVGPETPVALCVQPSFEMVAGLLAVLKAGGAYVPLDPAWPRERLTFVLEDTRAPVLLTQAHLLGSLPAWPGHLVQLDAEGSSFAANSREAPTHRTTPDNLAYIIYTSGSTGRPKGVMVPHRGVPNLVEALAAGLDVRPGSRVLQFASFSFDASVIELIVTLLSGATVCLAPRKELLPGPGLLSLLREQAVTTAMFPPSLLALLSPEGLDALHTVASAGEACSSEVVARWATSQRRFLNAYGPTEITVAATLAACTPDGQRPPLGRPLRNVKLYVLDRHLRPVPVGVPGELFIGGIGVTRGYLRRPELTAERFLSDPFSAVPGARMYRSGDLVRYRPDGTLDFLGRTDFQVKVRGFRIELGEIESALAQHPAVRQALVLAREDRPGDKRLVAYLVTAQEPAPAELRAFLQERLPEHMVPSAFVFLERMPLTSSGKVDRKALPAPDAASSGAPFVAPRTPTEELLAGIWAEVLGQPRVGVEDDFFALGGHSLLATQVLSRVRTAFSVDVPVRTLFEAPTVAGLAQKLELAQGTPSFLLAPLPPPLPRTGEWPLSFAQQRLWFLDQLAPGSPLYNIPSAVRLGGPLDVSALSRGLQELLRRHDALRTTFASREGGPVQLIAESLSIPLDVLDVAYLPPSEREARARELARQEALRPFDLERGPLVRTTLLRMAPEEHVLLLTLHHIASDGWSMSVLVHELAALYEAFSSGQPPSLPALSLQYADFACWQRSWLQGEVLQTQLSYWKQQLAGAALTLELPTDHPRPPIQTHRGARHLFSLPPALSEALTSYSRQQGVTLFMTLLGAFQALLQRYSGQDDIVIGSPIAGRNRAELEGLIGFFVNTLALRTHLGDSPSFRTLLARVRETTLGAYAHQDVPFEKLVEELQPARDLSRPPLFQVLFALQNLPPPVRPAAGLTLATLEPESGVAKFDLSLYVQETPRGLRGVLEYNTDLFEAATVVRLAGHFQTLLAGAIARPDQPLALLPLLSEDERSQLLVEWNDTGTGYPREACLHELFEAQAARTPEAPALIDGTRTLTYAELDRRANQLAHALRALGVGPESRVGICVRRSADVGVALLGILKAGAAYVPLDASWPRERLGYMLEDSGARVLVTQGLREDTLPSSGTAVARLDLDAPAVTSQSTEKPPSGAVADNLAYLIYTSGSTGRPKGVQVPHRTVSNFFTAMDARLQVPARGVWLAVTSISFDISVLELLWTLSRGFTVVVREDTVGTDWLPEAVHRHGVTHLQCTPSLARALVQDPASAKALRHLRQMLVGGEALPTELARELRQHVSSLLNMYGPTETTVWSSTHARHRGGGARAAGHPHRQHAAARPGRAGAAGARGHRGRAVHRRRGRGARLPGPAGADGGALPAQSLQRGARGAPVPHRGPGALARGWHGGVPGPGGLPGEGAGLPHRVGGGGSGAGATPGGAPGRGRHPRGGARRHAAGGLPRHPHPARARRHRVEVLPPGAAARIHGALRLRGARAAPAHPQW